MYASLQMFSLLLAHFLSPPKPTPIKLTVPKSHEPYIQAEPEPIQITVHPSQTTIEVSPNLYGIFFEEINCAGDGGIYPELIRNRSFEDSNELVNWKVQPQNAATLKEGKVTLKAQTQLRNSGFYGMHIVAGEKYTVTLRYSASQENTVSLAAVGDEVFASKSITLKPGIDQQITVELTPKVDKLFQKVEPYFSIITEKEITLDFVSLFPKKTFNNRTNGLRPDLMSMLKGIQPSFMRFPGGCWVEGDTMAFAQRWKTTVGDLHLRKTQPNIWGYVSTNGLGYHEYLQMCEDLGAAALFVVNCGMSHREVVPMNRMDEFVQDALDAIEYANGSANTFWGAKRAANGHPKPFNLRFLEIGNENGGPAYEERYALIYNAVKKKYPNIITIANDWGGRPKGTPIEVIDEHYYSDPAFFFRNANKYDNYDRKGPKVYVGEYAVTQGCGSGNLIGAISEAAFMMGMERNSDIVTMASYAPLFANVSNKAWNPDLIYFDKSKVYGTPSYYVQRLFSQNKPTRILKSEQSDSQTVTSNFPIGGIGVGTWKTQSEFKDIKVRTNDGKEISIPKDLGKNQKGEGDWSMVDGALRQTSFASPAMRVFGDIKAESYTLSLKARKLGGDEGFLVSVGQNPDGSFLWFNIGGWMNKLHGLELSVKGGKSVMGRQVPGTIETGRWYDIEIDYTPKTVTCRIDGNTIFNEKTPSNPTFFSNAGIDAETNEIVVKCVSAAANPRPVSIKLDNLRLTTNATGVSLDNPDLMAENSMSKPQNVAPKRINSKVTNGVLTFTPRPYSLTIWRIPTKGNR